jgi:hypothetical protein
MIALGWTLPGAAPPAPLRTVAMPDCAAVAAGTGEAADAWKRLRLQVMCARALPAFLPLAPRRGAGLEEAIAHARDEGPAIAARLAAVMGRAQITLRAAWDTEPLPPVSDGGSRWLRARAARRAREEARAAAAAEELRAVLGQRWPVAIAARDGGVRADALVEAGTAEKALADLARRLAGRAPLAGAKVSLTGPWPAFSFCGSA